MGQRTPWIDRSDTDPDRDARDPARARRRWVALASVHATMWAAVLQTSPVLAAFVCTDEWGRTYVLPQPMVSGLAAFKCQPVVASATSAKPAGLPNPQDAAYALALPTRAVVPPPRGRLAVVVSGGRAGPSVAAAEPFGPLISEVARQFDHDVSLMRAIIHVESRFNPNALSPKGAIGLMQVMPATARGVGIAAPEQALFDPETNLIAGARYLRKLVDMFPDRPELAIAAYNAGEGAVLRYRGQVPPFPETQAYVRQVQARLLHYRNP